jgi:2-iminobutanoate/2-iminopropanoate deaminase
MWSPRSIRNRWNSISTSNERPTCRQREVAVANREGREEVKVAGVPEPISHYCPVVRAGRMVFISGMEPKDENGNAVGKGDVTAQARQVHENLKKCLAAAGATFADVCKVTVFVRNISDRPKINEIRKEYFGNARPASTLVEISRLASDDFLVEIEAVALLPS